ncbi:MAG: glycerate kinase [Candidatus Omnitrophica bacterium]|nr:glycerate kinase [Candidatus Omnitrophota bacterium]
MRIVIAPNSFKECMTALEVAKAMASGASQACPDSEILTVPLADGGDGTAEAIVAARRGRMVQVAANDPLMRPVKVQYGLFDDDRKAVIEMAAASGLWRLKEHEKNPLKTSTYGTGEMIRDALNRGVRSLIVGIGGSATTDAGMGMASALGYRFLDEYGNELAPIGDSMNLVAQIDSSNVLEELHETEIFVASDVTNPLLGPNGAAPVYAPQKGATPEMVEILEKGLSRMSSLLERDLNAAVGDKPGGGAAGGLGAGLMAFCDAQICSGFDLIADYARLDDALDGAALAITGEGKIDSSTQFGKVPAGVMRRAQAKGVPVVGIAGALVGDRTLLNEHGMAAMFSIAPGPISLQDAMEKAGDYLAHTTEQVVRLWQCRT